MKLALLSLITANQYRGFDNEDPYNHLATFYELYDTMGILREDEEENYLGLFPFTLFGKAKIWLQLIKFLSRKDLIKTRFPHLKLTNGAKWTIEDQYERQAREMIDLLNMSYEKGGNLINSIKTKAETNLKCHECVQMQIVR